MKELISFCGILALIFCSASTWGALDRIGDFALLDQQGEFHQLSRFKHKKAHVMMSYSQKCNSMDSILESFTNVRSKYLGEDFEFVLIDSEDQGRAALTELSALLPTGLSILEDDGQLVSETLNISRAGEVLVFNPQRLSLYYRGEASTQLDIILHEVATGNPIDTAEFALGNCILAYPMREQHASTPPDFSKEVAPIIIENCAECHRQGGVGPFALDSYIMVLGWSPMIREVLLSKRMPPAQVDPYIGHSADARYLSKENLQTLVHWIDAGAPRGESEEDPLEVLATKTDAEVTWILGEPDFIVTGPDNEIAATGVMDYIYEDVELGFNEDKWIRALQYKPGDEAVLHHLMTFVTAPNEDFWGSERDQEVSTRRFVEGYAPGEPKAIEFTAGTGVLIPQGHKLSMQFHYVTNGLSTVDATELGLYFAEEAPDQERLVQAVSSRFVLPPNDANFAQQAQHVFDEDIIITGVRARMNYRGKKMKFIIEETDGRRREIFSVPAYNYGWQPHYILREPQRIIAGSTLYVVGAFDNSISNPLNPDPEKEISFGLETWDEMFTGYFTYHRPLD
jgi:hypothetical protein